MLNATICPTERPLGSIEIRFVTRKPVPWSNLADPVIGYSVREVTVQHSVVPIGEITHGCSTEALQKTTTT